MASKAYTCADRFLKYVTFDTQSSEESATFPSTEKQKLLAEYLVTELKGIGLTDAVMDTWGYVFASLPGNVDRPVPAIGLIAHMDTSPDVSGANVKSQIHRDYQGGDLALDAGIVIDAAGNPVLADKIGHDIITSDGNTLLGADNKAGIAEIVDAVHYFLTHPDVPHGTIKIAFTPDEEVGRGTEHFDVKQFSADYAYTIDGGTLAEIEDETFCADTVIVKISGVNVHPGYAKAKLVNAVKIVAQIVDRLPKNHLSPETTEKREGYVHPHFIQGGVEEAMIKFLIRDFSVEGLAEKEQYIKDIVQGVMKDYPQAKMDFKVEFSYRNMKYELDKEPQVVDYALEAVKKTGLTPLKTIIRGGTDGARLSFQGLLTPNIFTGGQNFHSKQEWISIQDMQMAVEVIVNLIKLWEEKS
jgi:tripeptide aminopeptidase